MYVGRFVVIGPEVGAYRVSSRSFPNRRIVDREGTLTVAPTPDAPETDNPYVSYNCVRTVAAGAGAEARTGGDREATPRTAVLGNGAHVDPIAEKLALGYPARDALAEALLALDFEKDDYDTPRVAGVVAADDGVDAGPRATADDGAGRGAYVGVVRRDALLVERVTEPTLVATYEADRPTPVEFAAADAAAAASEAYAREFEHAVCAAGVRVSESGVETAVENGG